MSGTSGHAGRATSQTTIPADDRAPGEARRLVAELLDARGVDPQQRQAALLVASELVSNAVDHGSRPGDEVGLSLEIVGQRLSISVTDAARGTTVPIAYTPDAERAAQRGLQIVDQYATWSEMLVQGRREVRAELSL